jgi:D-proline reductase (dithiol) PrdB
MNLGRFKNIVIAKVITRFPSLADRFVAAYTPWESEEIPWTPVKKALLHSRIAIVTTAGVHHRDQKPFDMQDREGDPSYRTIDLWKPLPELMITHDYYDHTDADKDINIVFPIERLKEFERLGLIGHVSDIHYGFMGHITGRHIPALINKIAPEVARKLHEDNIDAVLLTPG